MEIIESWLGKEWEQGVLTGILGSIIGAFLIWSVFKLIGISNKSIKWLWITYKKGNTFLIEFSYMNKDYLKILENQKHFFHTMLILFIIIYFNIPDQLNSDWVGLAAGSLFLLTLFLYLKLFRIIGLVYEKRLRNSLEKKQELKEKPPTNKCQGS